jgi:hypothetical protein
MRLAIGIVRSSLLGCVLILAGPAVRADQVWTVSLDTSQLAADFTAPFALDFELIGSNGNTVTLSNFSFGNGGSAGPGPAFLTGGATGDLGGSVSLDSTASFFGDFNQQFSPGSTLTFTMDSTLVAPPSGGVPDNFSMVILEGYDPVNGFNPITGTGGTTIPTTDPSGADTFFNFNVNGPGSIPVSVFPSANGDISITVTSAGAVPEPSSGVILLLGMAGMSGALAWRHNGFGRNRASL